MRIHTFLSGAPLLCLALGIPQLQAQCLPPPANLVSWWPGDGSAEDIIGVNSGVPLAPVSYVPGYVTSGNGQAFSFDGSTNWVDVGTDPSLDVAGGDHSISVWLRWTSTSGNARGILSLGYTFSNSLLLCTGFSTAGQDKIGYAHNGVWYYNAGSGLNDGLWHHVAVTKSGATVRIYIDRTEVSYSFPGGVNNAPRNRIGSSRDGQFAGDIDELALWSRALDPTEVEAIYDAGSDGKCKPVVCQPDLGFQGPGNTTASLCGAGLNTGETSDYETTGAEADAPGALLVSFPHMANVILFPAENPGTLVSAAGLALALPIVADGSGNLSVTIPGVGTAADLVFQSLFADSTVLPHNVAFTNAIRGQFGQ